MARSGQGWEGIAAYRGLVGKVAASEFAARLYALRSLDFVVISPAGGWPERASRPSITLRPCADGHVSLALHNRPRGKAAAVEEVACPFGRAWAQLVPWLQWLSEDVAQQGDNGGQEPN
jgi:hypothetical protein